MKWVSEGVVNILRWGVNNLYFQTVGQALFLEQLKSSLDTLM